MGLVGLLKIRESSIDYPESDLTSEVWNKQVDSEGRTRYLLKPQVKSQILDMLKKYEALDLIGIATRILVVGSIGSNLYEKDSDIDVHINTDMTKVDVHGYHTPEEYVASVFKFYRDHREFVGDHPLEVYLQFDPQQDLGYKATSAYDLINDKWLVGPKIVSSSYDPYDVFADVVKDLKASLEGTDANLSELERDLVDYDMIKKAVTSLSDINKEKVRARLQLKLDEIENDIVALVKDKEEFKQVRRHDVDQAKTDLDKVKDWEDSNAKFKFIQRYGYLRIISALEEMLKRGSLGAAEVETMKTLLGRLSPDGRK